MTSGVAKEKRSVLNIAWHETHDRFDPSHFGLQLYYQILGMLIFTWRSWDVEYAHGPGSEETYKKGPPSAEVVDDEWNTEGWDLHQGSEDKTEVHVASQIGRVAGMAIIRNKTDKP